MVDWAFGAVHVKIAVAFTLLGPDWWLRDALENIYNQESLDNHVGICTGEGETNLNSKRVLEIFN